MTPPPRKAPSATIRQPVHAVYGGAHLFKRDVASKLGRLALAALKDQAADGPALAQTLGWTAKATLAETVRARVVSKLQREPVEDYRIDFEDGFGARSAAEEDREARRTAEEVAAGLSDGTLPPFLGIRIKPLDRASGARAARTLELHLKTLAQLCRRRLPRGYVVTLPKVERPEQAAALAKRLGALESKLRLPRRSLSLELMLETPAAVLAPRALVEAAGGRCVAVHFGPYDLAASLGIPGPSAALDHPALDVARTLVQLALAGSPVRLADGPTSLLPVGPDVARGWKLHFEHVRRQLAAGWFQGWDLHPAQLVSRYAAVYSYFLSTKEAAAQRLRRFQEGDGRATRTGSTFDDAATIRGLDVLLSRGVACGALSEAEAAEALGTSK